MWSPGPEPRLTSVARCEQPSGGDQTKITLCRFSKMRDSRDIDMGPVPPAAMVRHPKLPRRPRNRRSMSQEDYAYSQMPDALSLVLSSLTNGPDARAPRLSNKRSPKKKAD